MVPPAATPTLVLKQVRPNSGAEKTLQKYLSQPHQLVGVSSFTWCGGCMLLSRHRLPPDHSAPMHFPKERLPLFEREIQFRLCAAIAAPVVYSGEPHTTLGNFSASSVLRPV